MTTTDHDPATEAGRAALRKMCEAATPEPWEWWASNSWRRLRNDCGGGVHSNVALPTVGNDGQPDIQVRPEDMAFIAAARTALPAALDRIEALERHIATREEVDEPWRAAFGAEGDLAREAVLADRAASTARVARLREDYLGQIGEAAKPPSAEATAKAESLVSAWQYVKPSDDEFSEVLAHALDAFAAAVAERDRVHAWADRLSELDPREIVDAIRSGRQP